MLLMEVSKCWNYDEFPKISIKKKNFKQDPNSEPPQGNDLASPLPSHSTPPPPPVPLQQKTSNVSRTKTSYQNLFRLILETQIHVQVHIPYFKWLPIATHY